MDRDYLIELIQNIIYTDGGRVIILVLLLLVYRLLKER